MKERHSQNILQHIHYKSVKVPDTILMEYKN
jgi:hypothetical protein